MQKGNCETPDNFYFLCVMLNWIERGPIVFIEIYKLDKDKYNIISELGVIENHEIIYFIEIE